MHARLCFVIRVFLTCFAGVSCFWQEVEWVSEVSTVKDNSWLADSFSSLLGAASEVRETRN